VPGRDTDVVHVEDVHHDEVAPVPVRCPRSAGSGCAAAPVSFPDHAGLPCPRGVGLLFAIVDDRTWGPLHLQLPDLSTVRPTALAITCAALVMVFGPKWSVLRVLGVCAVLGLAVAGVTALG
jgi:hypothetical protein